MDSPTPEYHTHGWRAALVACCAALPPVSTAVVHPSDATALGAAIEAAVQGLITPILVGPEAKIRATADAAGLDISAYRIEDAPHSHAAADRAVALVRSGDAQILMKGSLHTDEFMHAVMAADTGLRTKRRVSHVYLMDVPRYPRPILITDAAINVVPSLADKRDIVQNAIDLAHVLGIAQPRVAILAPVEVVNPKLPSTLDAAALCKMADRGQITGALVDGPLAFDNAISPEAAKEKGIVSDVAGRADILVVPNLVSGNILAKQLTFLAGADAAGVVVGARVPIVLTSRADSKAARIASCAVAVLMAHAAQAGAPAKETGQQTGAHAVFKALESRTSTRGYLDRPVPLQTVERILQAASRAPSGNNSQPWRVHVLTGAARDRLGDAVLAWRATGQDDPAPEYAYYPDTWPEPYLSRRRANGWDLYGLLGIAKGDRTKARAWHDANFRFFGAPVGMVITRDRRLGLGALIDLGMFMEGVAVAARGMGLDTCPQAAWAHHHAIIRRQLALVPEEMVICGMSLGHADPDALANRLRTGRETVDGFATFHTGGDRPANEVD